MIVKIWPIKAHYPGGKNLAGGAKGLKNALDYITDDEKVIVKQNDLHNMNVIPKDGGYSSENDWDRDEHRVLNYMANKEKIDGKYISGYLCDADNAVEQFGQARDCTLGKADLKRVKEKGAIAFHLVQSFPEGLNISDEEVHQCGLDLCEKINAHQAVVCSHVHPQIDEKGKVHGKSKHNHILLNAYIHPSKLPDGSKVVKYHDCQETYALLQVWNDEIAIDHGLPIIRNPDKNRVYSWFESDAANKGLSWKERIRLDIEAARRSANNWEQFVAIMENDGYQIRDGAHISYTSPDGQKKARGDGLGREYTKEGLQLYWKIREFGYKSLESSREDNDAPMLYDIVLGTNKQLKAAAPLGAWRSSGASQQYYYLPLENATHKLGVLETYFNADEVYDICDENNRPVVAATGREILECMELMRDGRQRMEQERYTKEERMREMLRRKEEEEEKELYYMNSRFRNRRTRKPYRCLRFNDDGTRRSSLELLLILAATVLFHESGYWDKGKVEPGHENDPIFGPRDWKIQNIIDSIYIADEENIETQGQLDDRIQETGASLSRARSALNKATKAKEKMETLNAAVSDYLETREIAESIISMEDGPEKERMQEQNADALERYKTSKAVLYRYNTLDDEKIIEFQDRYEQIGLDIQMLQERFDNTKVEYRRLKKLSYNLELAQNERYCYGPAYTADKADGRSIDDLLKDQKVAPAKEQPGKETEPPLLL